MEETIKKKIKTQVSKLFQLEEKEFNLRDLRSLQYPLLSHVYTLPYDDIWNEKYLKVYHQKEDNTHTNKRGPSTPPPEEPPSKQHKYSQKEPTGGLLKQYLLNNSETRNCLQNEMAEQQQYPHISPSGFQITQHVIESSPEDRR